MFGFGDELILGNYRIPWLIWIQLVVTFLLIVLLYYFSFIALDLSDSTTTTSIASPSTTITSTHALFLSNKNSHNPTSTTTTSNLHHTKVGESQIIRGEVATSTSRRVVRGLDIREREDLSTKNETHFAVSENSYHPCYYVELAKQAFLKCFGLDCTAECSTRDQNKED